MSGQFLIFHVQSLLSMFSTIQPPPRRPQHSLCLRYYSHLHWENTEVITKHVSHFPVLIENKGRPQCIHHDNGTQGYKVKTCNVRKLDC